MTNTSQAGPAIAQPAIKLAGVNLSLGHGAARVHILKDIDLNIGSGEAIGLVGPSGSGKSTLLMVMAGLERADTGTVAVAGETSAALDEDALARFRGRNVGIVFQSFHLIPTMTALENVAVPLELAGVADAQERARARTRRGRAWPNGCTTIRRELSGGEQQRVAVARALAPNPAILVADEPTGNLDEDTGKQIIDLLFAGHAKRGTTLVLVTHDAALAAALRARGAAALGPHRRRRDAMRHAQSRATATHVTTAAGFRCALRCAKCAAACAASTCSSPASRSASWRSPASARSPPAWPTGWRAKAGSSSAAICRSR